MDIMVSDKYLQSADLKFFSACEMFTLTFLFLDYLLGENDNVPFNMYKYLSEDLL